MSSDKSRVVIVGGGVLGTMHAIHARRLGHSVVHLEREPEARGASVRNFGLIWVSGRKAGPELALALRARQLWEEISAEAPGIGFRAAGSLTIAASEAELRVLEDAAKLPEAALRDVELLSCDAVREANPALRGDFLGGLLCRADGIVEPRLALPALRAYLAAGAAGAAGSYEWLPGREAVAIDQHGVRDHTGTWHRGDLVVLCTGASLTGLTGPHLLGAGALASLSRDGTGLRRVRLQMLQTAPFGTTLTTSVADGDTLRYYPAYDVPSRDGLAPQPKAAAATRAQLLMVQRLDGGLTIGDTHEYDEPFTFDVDEDAYDHLRSRAEALLGAPLPRTQRRWAGVYCEVVQPSSATSSGLYHRSHVADGVVLVTGPGGRGMTCSPAIAEETFQ